MDSENVFQSQKQASTSAACVDRPPSTGNNTVDYTLFSETCARVSNRNVAAIACMVSYSSTTKIIDENMLYWKFKMI